MQNMGKRIDNNEAQKIELQILIDFSRFCEKHNLRYYLAYGTLLGAIRHKGFIPWDNDVDVSMPRPDYEKFIRLWDSEEHVPYYKILDYHNTVTFPFIKLIDDRTNLKEHFLITEHNLGLYIDVFPIDGMPFDPKQQERLYRKANVLHKLFTLSNYRLNTGGNLKNRILKFFFYPFSRIIPTQYVCKCIDRLCRKYDYDTAEFVGNIVYGFEESAREVMPKADYDTTQVVFENVQFNAPLGYDSCLKKWYGNYMELPPEEKREVHQFDATWK